MQFDLLKVSYVRNLTNINIEPSAYINIIVGPNASGKTALLEAIHLLARARSFRTPHIKDVIQHNQDTLRVIANISNTKKRGVSTGIEKSYGNTVIRHNGESLKTVSEQVKNIPLIVITPDSHLLVTGSPRERRHWLDWAMFHVEPSYIDVWRNYQKALRNRNLLLKSSGNNQQITGWERSMWKAALVLDEYRRKFVEELQAQLSAVVKEIFPVRPRLRFNNGGSSDILFEEYLFKDREKDRQLGYTKCGPHKADIRFLAGDLLLAQVYSRGQIKKFVTALLLAQAKTSELIIGEKPVFLIDDYAAELDGRARLELLTSLKTYGGQVFLTSTENDEALTNLGEASLFHVEHGNINKVVK